MNPGKEELSKEEAFYPEDPIQQIEPENQYQEESAPHVGTYDTLISQNDYLLMQLFQKVNSKNLREIFALFDKDKSGKIELSDLEAIMTSLRRDQNKGTSWCKF